MVRVRRTLLAAVPQIVAAVPAVVLLTTAGDRLPDPVASHWGLSGVADRFTGIGVMTVTTPALGVGLAVLFGATSWFAFTSRPVGSTRYDLGRWFVGVAWGEAAFLRVVMTASVVANLDLSDAAAAVLPGTTFPLALLAAAVAAPVGGLLAPRTPAAAEPAPVPAAALGATERISWTRSAGSAWLRLVGAVLVAVGIAVSVAVAPPVGVVLAAAGLLTVLLCRAHVTVDRRGLTVSFGPFGWPRVRVPADDVAEVTVAEISPMQFGGWGYRVVPGGSGVILRSGEALVVTRRSGRRFTVTVDDATTAAGLLTAVATRTG